MATERRGDWVKWVAVVVLQDWVMVGWSLKIGLEEGSTLGCGIGVEKGMGYNGKRTRSTTTHEG